MKRLSLRRTSFSRSTSRKRPAIWRFGTWRPQATSTANPSLSYHMSTSAPVTTSMWTATTKSRWWRFMVITPTWLTCILHKFAQKISRKKATYPQSTIKSLTVNLSTVIWTTSISSSTTGGESLPEPGTHRHSTTTSRRLLRTDQLRVITITIRETSMRSSGGMTRSSHMLPRV